MMDLSGVLALCRCLKISFSIISWWVWIFSHSVLDCGPFCLSLVSATAPGPLDLGWRGVHGVKVSAVALLTEALAAPGFCVLRCQRGLGSKPCYVIHRLFT